MLRYTSEGELMPNNIVLRNYAKFYMVCQSLINEKDYTNIINVNVSLFVTLSRHNYSTDCHETLYTYP